MLDYQTYCKLNAQAQHNAVIELKFDTNKTLHKILALMEKHDIKALPLNVDLKPLPPVQKRSRGTKTVEDKGITQKRDYSKVKQEGIDGKPRRRGNSRKRAN